MKSLLFVATIPLFLLAACQDIGIDSEAPNLGVFSYTSFDNLGNTKERGSLVLHRDNETVTGTWQFQPGRSGKLEGFIADTSMTLNLNPGVVDNNLVLRGKLTPTTYEGEWQQIGLPGIMDSGRFSAFKQ